MVVVKLWHIQTLESTAVVRVRAIRTVQKKSPRYTKRKKQGTERTFVLCLCGENLACLCLQH